MTQPAQQSSEINIAPKAYIRFLTVAFIALAHHKSHFSCNADRHNQGDIMYI